MFGCVDIVKYLVEQCGGNIGATNRNGDTELLLEQGNAFIEAKDNDGRTALQLATSYNKRAVVKYLMAHCHANVKAE
jgi:ankyrin repeat protein